MKIGLALSGGGMRGIAHAGVLKALEENDIKIDIIGGTSAGSMVASLYAIGYRPNEIYTVFKDYYRKIIGKGKIHLFSGIRYLTDKKTVMNGFKNGETIEETFDLLARNKNIDNISNIKMPIVIPTVDIFDAKEYVFTNYMPSHGLFDVHQFKGESIVKSSSMEKNKLFLDNQKEHKTEYITDINIGKAVRASSSFPAVFNLCTIDEHAFIDGGALDNVPVKEVRKQGADKVIAVKFDGDKLDRNCNIMDVVFRTIDIMGNKIVENEIEKSDYILNIHTNKVGLLETNKIEQCFKCGYEAVKSNIDEIKNALR